MKILLKSKPSKKKRIWSVFIILCIVIILAISLACLGLSEVRKSVFISGLFSYRNLTNIVQHATQAAFLARKGNVMSFQGADSS